MLDCTLCVAGSRTGKDPCPSGASIRFEKGTKTSQQMNKITLKSDKFFGENTNRESDREGLG